ncbi:MAG TPA: GNAT family N-acetyltransferase [Allosphingosinicella sp.]|jgi:N-acetylglutamate synthase-like GNAT family acetyltransferase
MADPRDQMLREMAAHRGLRLVRSRRRKPGGDYGRYGLTDLKTGQDCFGIGKDGLEASAEEIEEYLRRGAKADWKRSLGSAGKAAAAAMPKRREKALPDPPRRKRRPEPEPEPEQEPDPEPELEPELIVREAKVNDADAIAALVGGDAAKLRASLRQLVRAGEAPFVAERGGIVGCAAWHVMPTLQQGVVGRLTLLVVAEAERRGGVGTALLEAVEARLAERGCARMEAVSDIDFANAHGFFRKRGYERTSYRFFKSR